jgi:16S rRNA (guanine527-N7)-methyltransferase
LARWNRVHNLTAVEPGQTLAYHLLDSLSIVPTLSARTHGDEPLRVLDVGAGGGLPGIPLSIALPSAHVTLLDKVAKKVAFLRQVQVELRLPNIDVVHARVETFRAPAFAVIVARAFATLLELVRLSRPLLANDGCWCAMKGAVPRAEIEELEHAQLDVRIAQIVKLHVPRLDAERHLILIEPS